MYILYDILFAFLGWVYLSIQYKDKTKIKAKLNKEFAGKHSNVGKIIILKFFLGLLILGLITFLFAYIYRLIFPLN